MKRILNYFKGIEATSGNLLYQALLEGDEVAVVSILRDSKPAFSTIRNGAGETHKDIFELALWSLKITKMLCDAYPVYVEISYLLEKAMQQRCEETAIYLMERLLESSKSAYKLRCLSETCAFETFKYLAKNNKLTSEQIRNIFKDHLYGHTKIVLDILEHHFEHLQHADLKEGLLAAIHKENTSLLEVMLKPEKNKFTEREMLYIITRALDPVSIEMMRFLGRPVSTAMLRVLMKNISLNGILLSELLTAEFFENEQKLLDFVKLYLRIGTCAAVEPADSRSKDWRSVYQFRAAVLLQISNVIKFKNNQFNNVDDNGRVARANKHFDEVVEPAFLEKFNSYGTNDEQRIKALEQQIRGLILDYILEHSEPSAEVRAFITQSRAVLVKGFPSALKASVDFFSNSEDIGYSAWRAYNPFAPIAPGDFENLLTPQSGTPKAIFTIPGATGNLREVNNYTASERVRRQVVFYYLAVTDEAVPDNRELRIANFIGRLADIRNAEGRDRVSCFPGHIYRAAEMGDFHPTVAMEMTLQKQIEAFMLPKILEKFKDMLKLCTSEQEQEREDLFYALITLRTFNAKKVFEGAEKVAYSDIVREGFGRYLGLEQAEEALYDEFLQQHPNETRHRFGCLEFTQILFDPTHGSLLQPLIQCYRDFCNITSDFSSEAAPSSGSACSSTTARPNPYEGLANQLEKLCERYPDNRTQSDRLNRLRIKAGIYDELAHEFSRLSLAEVQTKVEETCSKVIKWSTQSAAAASSSATYQGDIPINAEKRKDRKYKSSRHQ